MALKYVDPNASPNLLRRGLTAFGQSRVGRWYGIGFSSRVDGFLLRRTGGRVRTVGTLPTALLGTTGAKTGAARQNPVLYFHDGPGSDSDVVLVASSFGRERHPGWYHNLCAHPACTLNGGAYVAREVDDPAECERLFGLAVRVYPGYADYKVRTDAVGRRIPILRLTPA